MAKAIDLPIYGKGSKLSTTEESNTWERYKGSRVREYLQNKVGATYRPDARQEDNAYHLLSFETTQTRDEWVEKWQAAVDAGDTAAQAELWKSDLIIDDTSLGGNTDIQNSVELISGSSQSSIVSTDGTLKLKLRFTSIEYNPVTQKTQDTGESATLVVERRASSNDNWVRVTTLTIPSIGIDETDSYTEIDLSDVLSNGTWQLRCTATGQVSEMTASAVQFGSVIKTKLVLESKTAWQYPVTTSEATLSYSIQGAVAKTLYYEVSNLAGTVEKSGNVPIGTVEYTETTRDITISDLTHGVHNIKAWLGVDGTTTVSDAVNTQIMVVTDSTDTSVLFVVNNVADTVVNYVQSTIFGYAVYNPNTDGTDISFTITDYKQTTTYASNTDKDVKNGDAMIYANTLEIESQETSLNAYIHIYDADGNELRDAIGFVVDNSQNFAPTSNADFILNPKTRSNNDNPESIINAANGNTVSATFTNFGFATDGWTTDDNGIKVLRVPSGSEVDIDYEPLSQFATSGNKTASMTMEFDIATRNVVDEDAALLKVCSYNSTNNNPLGFELKPLEAVFMTSALQTKRDQDIMFQDNTRTHIAVNIVYNLSSSGVNYIRIFVNGVINREMAYEATDSFLQYVNSVLTSQGIRIGAEGADIDIYGIRIYKRALSAANIRQDYIASLETTEEKLAFREANDILGDGNLIDYTKSYDKYNTLLWTGSLPSYASPNKQIGDIAIHIVGDPAHSGEMKNVQLKGQGTSSMSYWKWNGQFKTSYDDDNGNEIETDWVDENGVSHGAGYQLEDGLPMATKLVWKINWASPQQSHKLGSVNLFTDLWKQVVGGNGITNYTDADGNKPYANCRVSTIQKPFMLFTRATENSTPVFYGLVTFGPGKADKPTFGYYKKVLPDMVMVEGSDNGRALVEHRVPWDDSVQRVEDDGDVLYYYNGEKQCEIDMGNEDMVEYFKKAANFVFLHNLNIEPYVGTYESMIADTTLDVKKQYWVTAASTDGSHSQFDLFRWDYLTSSWVNASTTKTNGVYDVLNLNTQTGTGTGNDWDSINNLFIAWRTSDFKEHIGEYYNTNDTMFCMQFLKMIAASDNRCKNTYAYTDPVSHLICWMQDDLDTIFATDNVGRKNKPYYVEEHDVDSEGANYWNGTDNVLYNTFEAAFADELRATMKSILTAMAAIGGSVSACMSKYYFAVQKYFPAVAYNEIARLLYEEAQAAQNNGSYPNGTPPITQSLGDQLQAEQEWWKRREVYISSYAQYGMFGVSDGVSGGGYLQFRSTQTNEETPANPTYQFTVTPAIWLYPSFAQGTTSYDGTTRVEAGQSYTSSLISSDGNTNMYLRGINYYKSIGVFGNKSLGENFNLSAEKLIEFDASKPDDMLEQFRPTGFSLNTPLMQTLDLEGAYTITGAIDLSALTKLQTINLKSTGITSVTIPETRTLKSVSLPAVTRIEISNVPNLTSFSIEDVANLQEVIVGENVGSGMDVVTLLVNLISANVQISKLSLTDVDWSDCAASILDYIADITDCSITGHIKVRGTLSLATITKLTAKFGDITDENNDLYIEYTLNTITAIVLTGRKYLDEIGTYKLGYSVLPTNGNNLKSAKWSISDNSYATINEDTGLITVTQLGNETANTKATVTLTFILTDGTELTATKDVYLFKHTLQLGDLVFADGTYSDEADSEKTVVGVCFYIDDNIRLMVSTKNLASDMWGLYNNSSNSVANIELADASYDAYDTPETNVTSHGLSGGNYITDDTYLDSASGDFLEFPNTVGLGQLGSIEVTQAIYNNYSLYFADLGISVGDRIAYGQYFTIQIIAHRNRVLTDENVNLEVPAAEGTTKSENTRLTELISEVVSANSNPYRQYYYPAASRCYAYVPSVKSGETLNEKFGLHHWFLPSIGENGRLYFYKLHGYTASDTDSHVIFDKANGAIGFDMGTSYNWASTEYSGAFAWTLGFSDGYVSGGYGYKHGSGVVRGVCAF